MDRRLRLLFCLAVILLLGCVALPRQPSPTPIPTFTPGLPSDKVPLHLSITDGVYPIDATITIQYPETGGELTIGPTDHIVLPYVLGPGRDWGVARTLVMAYLGTLS